MVKAARSYHSVFDIPIALFDVFGHSCIKHKGVVVVVSLNAIVTKQGAATISISNVKDHWHQIELKFIPNKV